jgi:hypothetical protein
MGDGDGDGDGTREMEMIREPTKPRADKRIRRENPKETAVKKKGASPQKIHYNSRTK